MNLINHNSDKQMQEKENIAIQEYNKKETPKQEVEYITATVPRKEHKIISKLAIDHEKELRGLYTEIIRLGLEEWQKQNPNPDMTN